MEITDDQLIEELKKRFSENKKQLNQLNRLTNELREVNKKLSESETMKTNFLSNIANEIVNPFASILGLSKNITNTNCNDWEKVNKMAGLIFREALSLDFQLKNIFSAAEIEAGVFVPEYSQVDINNLFELCLQNFENDLEDKKIKLKIQFNNNSEQKYFTTDANKIALIFANLLSNSINYSSQDSEIICTLNQNNDHLQIIMQDFGIGINKKDHDVIFDRFKRLDTSINSINRGHGLGLSIVKSLVEMLNGTIELKSSENVGTIITIILNAPEGAVDIFSDDSGEIFFDSDEIF